MDQEDTMDFKALVAKFKQEEILMKQPRMKPALPEKPKLIPPPQSPTHYLPAGARPSLLTSISHTLEGKTSVDPRVVFEENKESLKPLIEPPPKSKEKGNGKLKGKDKSAKGSKEKLDGDCKAVLEKKQKKPILRDKKFLLPGFSKDETAELVPAEAPPKSSIHKKGLLGFRKPVKKEPAEVAANPILDAPSPDIVGPALLIPFTPILSEMGLERAAKPQTIEVTPPIPPIPDYNSLRVITPPLFLPAPPKIPSPPAFIPASPATEVDSLETETSLEIEAPSVLGSLPPPPAMPSSTISNIPSPLPGLSQKRVRGSSPPVVPSLPPPAETELSAIASVKEVHRAAQEPPRSITASPEEAYLDSVVWALERADEMGPGKKTLPCDLRVFSALEKARSKIPSAIFTSPSSLAVTPTPEEHLTPNSPTQFPLDLPPIDYDDQTRNPKPARVNGLHRQASQTLEDIVEEGSVPPPQLMVVPPPPPRKTFPDRQNLGPAPQKPARPPSVNLSPYLPPPLEGVEIPAAPEFWEADTNVEIPEFDADLHSPESSEFGWMNGEYGGPDSLDGHTLSGTTSPGMYSNGGDDPEAETYRESESQASEFQGTEETPDVLSSVVQPIKTPQADDGTYECGENFYEDVNTAATKKKGKNEPGKKRKGPPKNPYDETTQPTNEEKSKTGRFGRFDKKNAPEGPDEKELKKKEKQRLEKEKKELKEQKEKEKREQKEKEKREQKEREKKENGMKKLKITGQEEAMYQATVTVTTKGRKNDLAVQSGEVVSIIRTTNCPKGKWLARNSSHRYGYISVDHVELDIKEMMEMGKKAAVTRSTPEAEVVSTESRNSKHYPLSTESFTDDSEEWMCDDDEPLSSPTETDPFPPQVHSRTLSMPEMGNKDLSINHQHSRSDTSTDGPHVQARHEALEKLATFFHAPKPESEEPAASTKEETSPVMEEEAASPRPSSSPQLELPDMLILPPPDLYADVASAL